MTRTTYLSALAAALASAVGGVYTQIDGTMLLQTRGEIAADGCEGGDCDAQPALAATHHAVHRAEAEQADFLSLLSTGQSPQECRDLGGVDCSDQQQEWAGEGTCVRNLPTQGSCSVYCSLRGFMCVKAMDNINLFPCRRNEEGHDRQNTAEDGCLQEYADQICVCVPTTPTQAPTLASSSTTLTTTTTPDSSSTTLTTTTTPDCAKTGTCSIYEDPHVRVFDGVQISLLAADASSDSRAFADYDVGDMWLVRSPEISIQARYLPDPDLPEDNLFVRAVAVGGPFLGGNKMILGPLDEGITWNGERVLEEQTSDFQVFLADSVVNAKRHTESHLVQDMSQTNAGVDIEFPRGVKLTVNRYKKHVNLAIAMPAVQGGQEGLCGNFNCIAADDELHMILADRDPKVLPEDSLFEQ